MVSPLIGLGIAALTKMLPDQRVWNIENLDSGEVLQGQFEAAAPTREATNKWASHTSLNRGNSIRQFVSVDDETISFQSRFFKQSALDSSPETKLEKLVSWIKIDPAARRPPIVQLWFGDGHLRLNCTITVTGITYGTADYAGGLRDVTFTINATEFTPFSLEDTVETDTRFARAKERDYYELLAFHEYGNPLLGDIIRKEHPEQQNLAPGDVVRLPSIEGIRDKTVTQTSIPLKTAFGRKDTPQRQLRIAFFVKRSNKFVSHLLQPSTTP